jgi:hypothetical protein
MEIHNARGRTVAALNARCCCGNMLNKRCPRRSKKALVMSGLRARVMMDGAA